MPAATGPRPAEALALPPGETRDRPRFDVPMGGDNGVEPYLACVTSDGSHCTMAEYWKPCGTCPNTLFEFVRREVDLPTGTQASYATICPRCLPLGKDGKNMHNRVERRTILGWVDKASREFIPVRDDERGTRP